MNFNTDLNHSQRWLSKILLSFLFIFIIPFQHYVQAQEYDKWAFGVGAGLNVNTNNMLSPFPIGSSSWMEVSYCDANGDLWFYTKGRTIYNYQTGAVCVNCIPGSNRRKVIVPKVGGSISEFYIFTVPTVSTSNNSGLSYHEYNATTNSISNSVKLGFTPGTFGATCQERLAAVPHSNGTDYWVVVKPKIGTIPGATVIPTLPPGTTNSDLYAYQISSSGVSNSPTISDAGYSATINPQSNFGGQSKFSPDKQYFASVERTSFFSGVTHLYRFNSSTGRFNHLFALPTLNNDMPIGTSFSPNSKVLYTLTDGTNGQGTWWQNLIQYDLGDLDCNLSTAPPSCVYSVSGGYSNQKPAELQLTTNGQILMSNRGSNTIHSINTPNKIGCNNMGFSHNSVTIGTGANVSGIGLPNNIDGKKDNSTVKIITCKNSCGTASFSVNGGAETITWDFGDGTSITGDPDFYPTPPEWHTSGTYFRPIHQFPPSGGTFTVTASTSDYSVSTVISIPSFPDLQLQSNSALPVCYGTNTFAQIHVTNPGPFTSISWTDCTPTGLTPLSSTTGNTYSFYTGSLLPGTYTICATGILPNMCSSTQSYTFRITQGRWPRITESTIFKDKSTCTATDSHGDIYMGGEFGSETQFENLITVSGDPNSQSNAYVAKYTDCDDIQWVAVSSSSDYVSRTSMDINRYKKNIYVTGRCEGLTKFYSGIDVFGNFSCQKTISLNGKGVYIATYDYSGCLLDVQLIADNSDFIQSSAYIASSNPTLTGGFKDRVYLAINVKPLLGSQDRLHIIGLKSSGTSLNMQWVQKFQSKTHIQAADISASQNVLGVTGKFYSEMKYYNPGQVSLGSNSNTSIPEAFVVGLRDHGTYSTFIPEFTSRINTSAIPKAFSEGTGIHLSNESTMYLSGNFKKDIQNPFNITNTQLKVFTSSGRTAGYIFRLNDKNSSSNPDWFRTIWSDKKMTAVDVSSMTNQVYFIGNWVGPEFFIDNVTLGSNLDPNKMYIYCIDSDGSITSPTTYLNSSRNFAQGGDFITPTRISTAAENVYVSGFFSGRYRMINDVSQNSSIVSTTGTFNSMLWRYYAKSNNGQAYKTDGPTSVSDLEKRSSQIQIYPNPTNQIFTVNLLEFSNAESFNVFIYDVTGKTVYQSNFISNTMRIDANNWKSGLYMIMIQNENESYSKKIMIGSH